MRHAPSSRLFSQPTQLLSTKQTSWTKLHLLLASKKQLVDTLAHLLESLPLCRHQVVGILFVGWTVPSHPKPTLNENPLNDPGHRQSVTLAQLLYWSYTAFDNPKVALHPARLFSLEGLLQFSSQRLPVKELEVRLDYIPSPMIKIKFSNTSLSMGALSPNSRQIHQMLLYKTAKCCKPFKEIDISLFRISVTRLISNAAKAERKHEASDCFFWKYVAAFRASWNDFSLIDDQDDDNYHFASTSVTTEFPHHCWHEMRHAPSSRLFSQPTQLLSTKQTSWTKLHLLLASKKQLVDTLAHLLESLPLCRYQVVGILFVGWTVPSHPKPTLNENPLKCQTLCHKKARLLNATWTIQTPPPGGSICIFFPAGTIRFGSPSRCAPSMTLRGTWPSLRISPPNPSRMRLAPRASSASKSCY